MSHERSPSDHERETRLVALAHRQGGALATRQISATGLSATKLQGLADRRLLLSQHRGVWRLGILTADGGLWAALLAMGDEATLSLHTAGREHAVLRDRSTPRVVHVTTPTNRRKRPGIHPHQAHLYPADVVIRRGLPFTSLSRTLLDLAAVLPKAQLDSAVDETRHKRRLHVPTIEATIARAHGHHGIGRLRTSIARHAPGSGMPRGERERLLSRFLAERDFPPHERNAPVQLDGEVYIVDVLFTGRKVVLEFDSRQFHDNDPMFDSDRRRIRRFETHGWRLIPIASTDLVDRPDELDADVKTILGLGP